MIDIWFIRIIEAMCTQSKIGPSGNRVIQSVSATRLLSGLGVLSDSAIKGLTSLWGNLTSIHRLINYDLMWKNGF